MATFTTIYRAGVMIATGVIVVKGCQLYGPTNEQVKTFAVEAFEMAQTAWEQSQQSEPGAAAAADPRLASVNTTGPAITENPPLVDLAASATLPPAATISPDKMSEPPLGAAPLTAAPPLAATEVGPITSAPTGSADRLPELLAHLQKFGVDDPQLTPWGSSGELYRFCCRGRLTETSAIARHFEAVATEPAGAVEQVLAKLEAWRAAEVAMVPSMELTQQR